jgi:hypothetical protein
VRPLIIDGTTLREIGEGLTLLVLMADPLEVATIDKALQRKVNVIP